jgi:hypothetical protein
MAQKSNKAQAKTNHQSTKTVPPIKLRFDDSCPVVEMKFTSSLQIEPGCGLSIIDSGANYFKDLVLGGVSVIDPNSDKIKHKIRLLGTTLPLLHELTRHARTELNFEVYYCYLHCSDAGNGGSRTYFSISPTTSQSGDDKKHILPARFHYQDDGGTIKDCIFVDGDKVILNDFIMVKKERSYLNNAIQTLNQTSNSLKEQIKNLEKSALVRTKCNLISFIRDERGIDSFTFSMEVSFFRYFWGELVHVLPLPEFPKPGSAPKYGLLLGVGECWWTGSKPIHCHEAFIEPAFWDKIESLNPILLDEGNQTVLVTGEPGSGKEVFSKAIHFGASRRKIGEDGIKTRAVANMSTKKLTQLLYGRVIDGAKIPGLIAEADQGTLFLDEVDKIQNSDFYSEFLRVLEAGEYVPEGSAQVEKVGDVNWIFAGAFTGLNSSHSTSALPPDFWSRLTSRIRIDNPLRYRPQKIAGDKDISYAGALFIYFLLKEASKLAGSISALMAAKEKRKFPADYAQKLIGIEHRDFETGNADFELSTIYNIGLKFQEQIGSGVYCSCKPETSTDSNSHKIKSITHKTNWCKLAPLFLRPPCLLKSAPKCNYSYDSVRSIIKAAKSAFTIMKDRAMTTGEAFWNDQRLSLKKIDTSQRSHEHVVKFNEVDEKAFPVLENTLIKIHSEAIKRAADVVQSARPGDELVR